MDNIQQFKDKSIYFVSDSDLDGISSRIIAEWFIKPITSKFTPYNTADRTLPGFDKKYAIGCDFIIFSDITPYSLELYREIKKEYPNILIFDHHISGRQILGDLENYYYDSNSCGTKILYNYLTEGKRRNLVIDEYVELVNTYDTWKSDSKLWRNAIDLHNILYSYVNWGLLNSETDTERYSRFINIQLEKFSKSKNFYLTLYEKAAAIKGKRKENESYDIAKRTLDIRKDNSENSYAYIELVSKASLVGNRIINELGDKIDYLAIYSTWNIDNKKISLRSKDAFDVSLIAEKWKGGGHKNASAFEFLSLEDLEKFRHGKMHLM